jgi:DNA repair protein RadC
MVKDASIYNQHPQYLGRFVQMVKEQVQMSSPCKVAAYLLNHVYHPFDEFEQEEVVVLLLNTHHWVTHHVLISRGTLTSALVRPADVFRAAVRANAAGLIIAHNHPSGEVQSSEDDRLITRRLVQAGEILGIQLYDHIIVGRDSWKSIREEDASLFVA